MMMMAIQKYCCLVSKFVVDVWDGLDESEISRPEILFQSAPGPGPYAPAYPAYPDSTPLLLHMFMCSCSWLCFSDIFQ